ncbi:peptidyl-tRNA hydrolase ICT1, mitochondrial isoform X5 [Alosa alosa]|uniref:peptidyl-tRNA hydrolase ICT1, mitochondrial isoform X5 n=1 Tax=Alosa alosa TaxID=278164 RepID=UPI00201540CD|nr:peptidyl-tRNA hydrolase ICT1, mitochondrial isoform X5 [Alosa alosa]
MFLVRQFGHKAFIFNKSLPFQCRLSQSFPYGSSRSSDNDRDQDQSGLVDIPIDRLKISYSRSSGPGGQHVNKVVYAYTCMCVVNSKAEVRFHVQTADWISAEVRTELLQRVGEKRPGALEAEETPVCTEEVTAHGFRLKYQGISKPIT